jgi:hypothetical protein
LTNVLGLVADAQGLNSFQNILRPALWPEGQNMNAAEKILRELALWARLYHEGSYKTTVHVRQPGGLSTSWTVWPETMLVYRVMVAA